VQSPPSGGGVSSEWWTYPPSAAQVNSRNEEFLSDVLDPAWAWWTNPAGVIIPGTADNNVTLTMDSSPATKPRYKVNDQRRPSWMQVQVPRANNDNTRFYAGTHWLLKPLTPNADDCYYTRTTAPLVWNSGGTHSAGIQFWMCLMGSAAGVPDLASYIAIGMQGYGLTTGGAYSLMATDAGFFPAGAIDQFILAGIPAFGIRRRASSNWSGVFFDNQSASYRFSAEIVKAFTPAFIGWAFRTQLAPVTSHNPIFEMDLLRCAAGADVLPL
jgi:hypothetical protein